MNNILIVSTSTYAGMGPYACSIINSFSPLDNIYFFLIENETHFFSKNIKEELKKNALILYRANSRANKLMDLFYPSPNIVKKLYDFCNKKEVKTIHFLTSETPYSNIIVKMQEQYNVFFTVHDLHPHESNKVFYKQFRHRRIYQQLATSIHGVNKLITNSYSQQDELKQMFPNKRVFYHEFPTLVNKTITEGKIVPPELIDKKDYILFFGRIESYKGIELLYNTFIKNEELKNKTLVIAGNGEIYFERDLKKEKNIIFINRYIKDEEIASLYQNATICVYPYISATQSGVLSLSCYYNVPIIASDVPFFQSVESNQIGMNFKAGNEKDLFQTIMKMTNLPDLNLIKKNEQNYYDCNFKTNSLKTTLLDIYSKK